MYWHVQPKVSGEQKVLGMNRRQKLLSIIAKPRYWPAAIRGVAPSVEHRKAFGALDFDAVIDVGANKGQFAAFAAAQWPKAHLFCFEPLPGPSTKLRQILDSMARGRSTAYDCALGEDAGTATIHIAGRDDSSSLLPIGERQKSLFRSTEAGTMIVQVNRLDNILSDLNISRNLLKIDVQGFELGVLRGSVNIISIFSHVYVEMSEIELYEGQALSLEVTEFLTRFGFKEIGRFNESLDASGHLIQFDGLFERQTR